MPTALAILVGAQLIGEVLARSLHLPLPGPVVGMFLLAVALVIRGRGGKAMREAVPPPLAETANALVRNMGLLFVPAGVGIITQMGALRSEWLPILAGMLVSTVLGLVVTGLVMQHIPDAAETTAQNPLLPTGQQEAG
jgi:holin-like protein